MSESDDMIQAYINKVLKIQQEQRQRPLDVDEMNRIAEELGMSESDRAFIQKKLKDYIARGQGYSRYEDWDSAIEEFEQALALNPFNVEVLYGLANAHKHRSMLKKNKDDVNWAKGYAKRALQINANHEPSLKLVSELNRGIISKTNPFGIDFGFKDVKDVKDFSTNPFKDLNQSFKSLDLDSIKLDANRKLRKSVRDKKIFGVCGGLAEYFNIDPTWVRIFFILGVIFGGGAAIPIYILMAFILPKN
ncbi:MAG: PspC domain-containing protein [Microscillaceae bacterium]|jgi:phage shock protein PspC (stress-responsive transcriptional regulator)|nr:PspC domain-containing protein [Microscillaceae bacterium]